MNKPKRNLFLLLFLLSFTVSLSAADIESAPRTFVEDRAAVLNAGTKQQLIGLLQELEQKTNARIIVLTVDSTSGRDIHQYAFERADQWKFGANQKSASILIVIAVKDRKYRIEVGYEHEAVITDGFAGDVGRYYFQPDFKAGNYNRGILNGTAAISQKIAQEQNVTLTGMPKLSPVKPKSNPFASLFSGIFFLLFIMLAMLGRSRGSTRSLLFWGLLTSLGGGRGGLGGGGGRFGGGGFGGGGFGSFGGGGGGGFGGGGAGGSW
jgi:uncharacterized protein